MTVSTVMRPTVHQDADSIVIHIPMAFKKRSGRKEIVLPDGMAPAHTPETDTRCPLKVSLARAFRWQKMIESGQVKSNSDLARKLKMDQSYIARTIRLASLAPSIIEAILDGQEPSGMSLLGLRRDLPVLWNDQQRLVGLEVN